MADNSNDYYNGQMARQQQQQQQAQQDVIKAQTEASNQAYQQYLYDQQKANNPFTPSGMSSNPNVKVKGANWTCGSIRAKCYGLSLFRQI